MSKKSHKALASATVMSLILTSTLTATVSAATGVERLSGSNRETTAIDVATKVFEKSETVVLVNGYKSADALSATPLAKAYNAPILSVGAVDEPSAALLAALSNLGAKKVVIVGGEGAVTKALANKLAGTYTIERIEGKDRYATNVNVAKKVMELKDSKEAFVVNGTDASYADALSIASVAASKGAPLVFTNGKTVSEEAKALVKDLKVTAIGGAGVVSADVLAAVDATRVGGADRFATNLEVLKAYKDVIKLDNVFVAYGLNFADALVASAAAAKTDAPVVLADKTNTNFTKGATDYIEANKAAIKNVYLVGGTGVIADSVKSSIDAIVNPVVSEFKVGEVKSENLKDLEVKFTQKVDKKTAEDKENYTLNESKEVEKVTLLDDGMTVRISVKTKLDNQKEYKLSVRNVRNEAKDKKAEVKDLKFKTLDAALPEMAKVEALGNKAVKITFTEPVDKSSVTIDSFRIDDKYVSGNVEADDSRVIILKSYNKLSDGEHTVTVKGVKDFAGYTMITKDVNFNVVEDKTAPVVESVTATFEKVRVKFSEPVQNVRAGSNTYWTKTSSTTTKNNSDVNGLTKISDDTYEFDFTANKLPSYEVNLYITGVKDYSENEMPKDKPILVTANLDQTRPEVTSVEVDKDTNKEIKVKFSKAMKNLSELKNYSLKDKDDKSVSIQTVESLDNGKTAVIKFYKELKEGDYTLKLEGLKDNTTLENVILPYEEKITVKDNGAPEVKSFSIQERRIMIRFSETMSLEGDGSIANTNNYMIKYNGSYRQLPEGTSIQVLNDSESVLIILPEKIGSDDYVPAKLTEVTVQRVEDAEGNILKDYSKQLLVGAGVGFVVAKNDDSTPKDDITLKDSRTIEMFFNQNVGDGVDVNDFILKDGAETLTIAYREVEGNKITLSLEEDLYGTSGVKLEVLDGQFKSVLGQTITGAEFTVIDDVKPELNLPKDVTTLALKEGTNNVIVVPFTETLEEGSPYGQFVGSDLVVKRVRDGKTLTLGKDFTATVAGKNIEIVITATGDNNVLNEATAFTVESKETPSFIMDKGGNKVVKFDAVTSKVIDKVTP